MPAQRSHTNTPRLIDAQTAASSSTWVQSKHLRLCFAARSAVSRSLNASASSSVAAFTVISLSCVSDSNERKPPSTFRWCLDL